MTIRTAMVRSIHVVAVHDGRLEYFSNVEYEQEYYYTIDGTSGVRAEQILVLPDYS